MNPRDLMKKWENVAVPSVRTNDGKAWVPADVLFELVKDMEGLVRLAEKRARRAKKRSRGDTRVKGVAE